MSDDVPGLRGSRTKAGLAGSAMKDGLRRSRVHGSGDNLAGLRRSATGNKGSSGDLPGMAYRPTSRRRGANGEAASSMRISTTRGGGDEDFSKSENEIRKPNRRKSSGNHGKSMVL